MAGQVVVAGGDLFRIAARQLGDARQWWRLAQANDLVDPLLSGVLTLVVPEQNAGLTSGLPSA